jgi:amino-acid racemase
MYTMSWICDRARRYLDRMRIIGLVGGTSWVSTLEYYRIINGEINARRGGLSSARLLLYSVDFSEIAALQARGDFDGVGSLLADAAGKLARIGAECVLLCANTMHMHAERVQAAIPIPLIHLVDATAEAVRRGGIHRVGLLGTRLTMEHGFYARRLAAAGIDVLVPDKEERELVHRTIEEELVRSVFLPASREAFLAIIRGLAARGAQGVVLGCTEIPLLVAPDQSPIPAFDTTRVHALAAVDFALSGHDAHASSFVDRR